jgi:hypothetical protein
MRWSRPRRAVQAGVSGDRLSACGRREVGLGHNRKPPARQALADVVIGLTHEPQVESRACESAERLAGRTAHLEANRAGEVATFDGPGKCGTE